MTVAVAKNNIARNMASEILKKEFVDLVGKFRSGDTSKTAQMMNLAKQLPESFVNKILHNK